MNKELLPLSPDLSDGDRLSKSESVIGTIKLIEWDWVHFSRIFGGRN